MLSAADGSPSFAGTRGVNAHWQCAGAVAKSLQDLRTLDQRLKPNLNCSLPGTRLLFGGALRLCGQGIGKEELAKRDERWLGLSPAPLSLSRARSGGSKTHLFTYCVLYPRRPPVRQWGCIQCQ